MGVDLGSGAAGGGREGRLVLGSDSLLGFATAEHDSGAAGGRRGERLVLGSGSLLGFTGVKIGRGAVVVGWRGRLALCSGSLLNITGVNTSAGVIDRAILCSACAPALSGVRVGGGAGVTNRVGGRSASCSACTSASGRVEGGSDDRMRLSA